MATVEFFYDFSSPYSYLGATQIDRVAAGHKVIWRPFLLGAVFKAVGGPIVPLETFSAAKQAYHLRELFRWAELWEQPFKWASKFPQRTTTPLRLALQVPDDKRAALSLALFRVMWAEDGDLEDRATLARVLTAQGYDAEKLLAGAETDEVKAALRVNTDEAVARGAFGAPTFFVNGEMFWGQDRLDWVKRVADGWKMKTTL